MKLSKLIQRLTEIQKESEKDVEVYLYTELGGTCVEDLLKDVAASTTYQQGKCLGISRVILIGTEED